MNYLQEMLDRRPAIKLVLEDYFEGRVGMEEVVEETYPWGIASLLKFAVDDGTDLSVGWGYNSNDQIVYTFNASKGSTSTSWMYTNSGIKKALKSGNYVLDKEKWRTNNDKNTKVNLI